MADAKKPDPATEYHVVLRPVGEGPPGWVRMKRLLKAALRAYGLKCMDIIEVPIGPPRTSARNVPS